MSYSFRQRIKMALQQDLKERLRLTQDEVDWIKENLMKGICSISDEVANAMKEHMAQYKGKSLDEIIDMMTKEQFEDFVREVLEIAKKRLNYKKKQKKKQKETESESESESDRESDADAEGSEESEQTQEKEQECAQ
jgi:hypothetical protein